MKQARRNIVAVLAMSACLAFGADAIPGTSPGIDIPALIKKAEGGNRNAQEELGYRYLTGLGVPKDDAQSVSWYRKAAEQGSASAQWNLGLHYAKGVPKDDVEAVSWFRKAAEQGDDNAQYRLGTYYANGIGVPKDDALAVSWWRKAADKRNLSAQLSLGKCYANGDGVPKDDALAYMWYNLAAAKGNADGAKSRDKLSEKMTSDQIAEAQRLSREWKPAEAKK